MDTVFKKNLIADRSIFPANGVISWIEHLVPEPLEEHIRRHFQICELWCANLPIWHFIEELAV